MAQRISDILPKKVIVAKRTKPSEVLISQKEIKKTKKISSEVKFKTLIPYRKILIPIFIFTFLGGVWSYFTLPNAKVIIWPKIDNLSYRTNLIVDKGIIKANFAEKIIPGQFVEAEKEISQEFSSSGKQTVANKAEGTIRIYNNYSTSSQTLVATTRFISDSGKLFRLKERVVVPGAKTEKGKLVASYIDAKVIADKAGDDYNIGSSTFSIPGFVGTPKYTGFYAKSFSQMVGGFVGEMPQVTKEDLEKAKNTITDDVLKELRNSFKNKISTDFLLIDGASQEKITEVSFSAKSGDNLATFNVNISAFSQGLVFKTSDLENFTKEYLIVQIQKTPAFTQGNKKIKEGSLKTNSFVDKLELNKGKLSLNLEINAKIYTDIDQDLLKKSLASMSRGEISNFFENQPQITRVEVKLWPFWVRKIPKNIERIEIESMLD